MIISSGCVNSLPLPLPRPLAHAHALALAPPPLPRWNRLQTLLAAPLPCVNSCPLVAAGRLDLANATLPRTGFVLA